MTGIPLILTGPLATEPLAAALGLSPATAPPLAGRLVGGAGAGLGGDWPVLLAGTGAVPCVTASETPEFRRYAAVMGLSAVPVQGRAVWGIAAGGAGSELGAEHGDERGVDYGGGSRAEPPLLAAVARAVLRLDGQAVARIRARLPQIAAIAAGRVRAAGEAVPVSHLPPPDPARVEIVQWSEPYAEHFSVEHHRVRHRLHDGGWSAPLDRAVFMSPDAALLLPYDPERDRVLVTCQFRLGPHARGSAQRWMLEPIAGRIDPGETPEATARREAQEEAGLTLGRLIALPPNYPTPAANSEVQYPFIGLADLPDQVAGQGFGVEGEAEDIATMLLSRAELVELALSGELQCGPLIALALMLDRHAGSLRRLAQT